MSRITAARRIAVAAAYGGGGLGLVGATVAGLLVAEAKLARRWIGEPKSEPPSGDGLYGHLPGPPISLVMLGDSSAAGLGVQLAHQTPGAMLAAGLAEAAAQPVRMTCVAKVGARSSDLADQLEQALAAQPDVAVIMVGVNDVTHRVRPAMSVRHLDQTVRALREAGAEVVVGTCPDLGTIEPVAQPLRLVARRWSRQLAAAQTIAVVEAGGRSVSLGDLLGPEFAASPREMFGPDRFHPSAAGYASAATVLLPSVSAALGYWFETEEEPEPDTRRGEGVRPVAVAAVEASDTPGTEVAGATVGGADRGVRGRWALLRVRGRQPVPDVEAAEQAETSAT